MKKYENRLNSYELRTLCIKNDWFNAGSNEQYEKLFKLNENGASVETLAALIWSCTDGAELDEITATLTTENAWPISINYLEEHLRANGWGETECNIIREALETHPDAGIAYKLI